MADLDPRTALDYAKRMKDYCDSFNGRDWSAVMLHGTPDEQNLAYALDNLTECAAMLANMAARVPAGVAGTAPVLTDEQCDEAAAKAMDRVAAAKNLHALEINPDVTAHHTLRRELIRAGFALAPGAKGGTDGR